MKTFAEFLAEEETFPKSKSDVDAYMQKTREVEFAWIVDAADDKNDSAAQKAYKEFKPNQFTQANNYFVQIRNKFDSVALFADENFENPIRTSKDIQGDGVVGKPSGKPEDSLEVQKLIKANMIKK